MSNIRKRRVVPIPKHSFLLNNWPKHRLSLLVHVKLHFNQNKKSDLFSLFYTELDSQRSQA